MIFGEIEAKSIIQKSGLSDGSRSVNPYFGCSHACVYCYACFMKRFSDHTGPWGSFVDAKVNAVSLFRRDFRRLKGGGHLFFGSVTDAYQPIEKKYRLTRGILEFLAETFDSANRSDAEKERFLFPELAESERPIFSLSLLTKSDLVLRDQDLLTRIPNISVGFSIALLDERARRELEPGAVSVERRLRALEEIHAAGIKTFVFIDPFLPGITPIAEIMEKIVGRADSVFGETLNIHCGNLDAVCRAVGRVDPSLVEPFRRRVRDRDEAAAAKKEFIRQAARYGIASEGFWDHADA